MKWIFFAAFHRESEVSARLEPPDRRPRHRLKIAKINQAVASYNQIELCLTLVQPFGNLGNLQLVIDAALPGKLDHLWREIDPHQARRTLLQTHARQPGSATNIENLKARGIADLCSNQLLKALRSLVAQVVAHLGVVVRGKVPEGLQNALVRGARRRSFIPQGRQY